MSVFAAIGPFDDELITGDHDAALERIKSMSSVEAVQLVLATYCRSDSVVDRMDLDNFAEFLGVFGDEECEECVTCGGNGTIPDGDTGEMRRCLDCRGTGK